MRLIDADALKLAFENCEVCKKCPSAADRCAYECTEPDSLTAGIERVIDARPTVDAVQVIRCKDCKYFIDATVNTNGFTICSISVMDIMPTDFCSYAESREKGEN